MKPLSTQRVARNAEPSFTFKDEVAKVVPEPVLGQHDIVLVQGPGTCASSSLFEVITKLPGNTTMNETSAVLMPMTLGAVVAQDDVLDAEFVTGEVFDPDNGEAINRAVREHSTTVTDWKHQPLMSELYLWADRFNERLFNGELPGVVLSFAWDRVTTVGTFRSDRDEFGIKYHINFNLRYVESPLAEHLSTLLHEMLHAWQELRNTGGKNNYHNAEFREQAAAFGIPCDAQGRPLFIEEGPFTEMLVEFGVPFEFGVKASGARPKGKSTLNKYRCPCGQNVWSGKKSLQAMCTVCGGAFGLCS